jgi:GNAT superfamily N-acetyltransferase
MLFVDSGLARRLEIASSWRGIEYARAVKRLHPGLDVAVEALDQGYAVYSGAAFPVNRAKGQGFEGPVDGSLLEKIGQFYRDRAAVPRVSVCPLADPSWLELLSTGDYGLERFFSVLARSLLSDGDAADLAPSPYVHVSIAGLKERDLWLRTVAQGFDGSDDPSPETLDILAPNFDSAHAMCCLARIDGEPAGGGELFIHEGVAELGSASTRPAFRRRGVHRALVAARLDAARTAGCDLAMALASPGSDSQHNLERAGFRLAYTQVELAAKK